MTDEQPNTSVPAGEEVNNAVATTPEISKKSLAQQKKEDNDLLEKEIEREKSLMALAGTAGGHVEAKPVNKAQALADEMANAFKQNA